jgi:hypothetical protein
MTRLYRLCLMLRADTFSAVVDIFNVPIPCPPGTINPSLGRSSPAACSPCANGTYSGIGQSSCSDCPSGSYCPFQCGSPVICPAGSYCPAKSGTPVKCDLGFLCSQEGLSQQLPCPSGHYCPSSVQDVPCPAGTFSSATGGCSGFFNRVVACNRARMLLPAHSARRS